MGLLIALALTGYLLGSVPFGLWIGRVFYHTDLRERGSGNTGATNVWRTLGTAPGVITLALDIVKGALPVVIARFVVPGDTVAAIVSGFAAILGHNWSLFLKGRGGKGVATSAGVFLALLPRHTGFAVAAFAVFLLTTKHVSVGSIAGALTLLATSFILETPAPLRGLIVAASVLILIKHLPNMKRLARGEEPKVKL